MNVDLRERLHALNRAQVVDPQPVSPELVLTRVHRRRAVQTAAAGLAAAAVVVGIGAVVYAAPWDAPPMPPATSTPTVTPEPSPEPTPDPTVQPPETAAPAVPEAPEVPPLVAVTAANDLVVIDPDTGEITRVVLSGISDDPDHSPALDVSPDGRHAYITSPGAGWPGEVQRVPFSDGTPEPIGVGGSPAVSPDGRTLAYVGPDPGADPEESRGLNLVDLGTGQLVRHIPDSTCIGCGRFVGPPFWSPDGSRLFMALGWVDGYPTAAEYIVEITEDTVELSEARQVGPEHVPATGIFTRWPSATFLADGRLVAFEASGDEAAWRDADDGPGLQVAERLAIVDPDSGAVTQRVALPDGLRLAGNHGEGRTTIRPVQIAASPYGPSLAMVVWLGWDNVDGHHYALYRWDIDGELQHLADDIVAVVWSPSPVSS